ncbi:hypothetical protein LEP1GSC202_0412 [Leptospira yanagawae serovar Saopaulo str. Sao Paulo = ATCC 700523]|uniref:Uncharacterized protein n=1 Tax=Leptospira yanagawae serovar Saopaulo str. Sao Paulo = ATCC 700523 TaxID=1249483 RepID=A0A5E8HHG7_9LEPT|nr:hypothetical protein LEP1GSC202_0412 [Leptospira yanagawae serovar Saopaulo str. Sao Paulo = ATCC 700523]
MPQNYSKTFSMRLTDTPARYNSIKASAIELSRRLYLSMILVSN